jgi:hypothetical protein
MAYIVRHALPLIALMAGGGFAEADPGPTRSSGTAPDVVAERIEAAFLAVAEAPPVSLTPLPTAVKGDLPPGCVGPFRPAVQSECLDAAYEPGSDPRIVTETRVGSLSILTRLHPFGSATLAQSNETAPTP